MPVNDEFKNAGSPQMGGLFNTAKEQRARILERLRQGPLTTSQARSELGVMHPATRVMELRKQGYWIEKLTVVEVADGGQSHQVARYSLVPDGARMPPSLFARMLRRPCGKAAP